MCHALLPLPSGSTMPHGPAALSGDLNASGLLAPAQSSQVLGSAAFTPAAGCPLYHTPPDGAVKSIQMIQVVNPAACAGAGAAGDDPAGTIWPGKVALGVPA